MPDSRTTYTDLLTLLRSGLYDRGRGTSFPGLQLSDSRWRNVLEAAEKQTVTGIAFGGISNLTDVEMPPVSVLAKWLAMANRESRNYTSMSAIISRLTSLFERSGLHPVIQKGHAAARFYNTPELRACGDIDIWFPDNERVAADSIIRSLGIKVINTPDNGSCYVMGTTEVEHHSMLVEIHNPFHSGLIRRVCREYPPQMVNLDHGMSVRIPSPMVELLMMNAHILKHCLGVGIGLRQFCDYSLAWRRFTGSGPDRTPQIDEEEYFRLCQRLGFIKWTGTLHRFINRYIPTFDGNAVTELVGSEADADVDHIFNLVCEGGNFGRYSSKRNVSSDARKFRRKLNTMSAFVDNRSFVCRLAPAEALWTILRLIAGQIH